MAQITLVEAVNLALHRAMADDGDVVVLGQDVGRDGGVFRATLGLLDKFGPERVIDTPLAENLIAGASIGMAADASSPASTPFSRCSVRRARSAACGSCVTITIVLP